MEQIELRTMSTNHTPGVIVRTRVPSSMKKRILIICVYFIVFIIAVGLIISPIIYSWSKISQIIPLKTANASINFFQVTDWGQISVE